MIRPRTLPDGSIVFPNRGNPPNEVPGYVRDPNDKFHFILDYEEECKFRKTRIYTMPCGKIGIEVKCEKLDKNATPFVCNSCLEGEP